VDDFLSGQDPTYKQKQELGEINNECQNVLNKLDTVLGNTMSWVQVLRAKKDMEETPMGARRC
jgi:hypothetical protein